MTRIVRAALTGLGAFVSELIPAQAVTDSERALLSAEALHEVLEPQQFPCTLGECWHDIHGYTCPYPCNRECPDPAATDAAAPAGSTTELTAADLICAAAVVYSYVLRGTNLTEPQVGQLHELADRLESAAEAASQ